MTQNEFQLESDKCEELRSMKIELEIDYMDLSEQFDIEPEIITYHVTGQCDCDNEIAPLSKDRPWTEKALLKYLLIEKNMDYVKVGRAFGCHQETVKNWAGEDRFDITIIESSERVSSPMVRKMHRLGVERSKEIDNPEELVEHIHNSS